MYRKQKGFYAILLLLIAAHSLGVIGILYDFPEVWHQGWYFHHGGDEISYFELGKSLANLQPIKVDSYLGYPLFLTPFVYLFNAETIEKIIKPVLIIQTFILFNLAIILVALISQEITNNKLVSGLTAFLWSFYPWILYLMVGWTRNFDWAGMFLTHHLWLPTMSDSSSAFLLFLGVYLFLLSLKKQTTKYIVFTAVFIGWATLSRPLNGIMALLVAGVYLYHQRPKDAIRLGLIVLAILALQFWYNLAFWKRLLMQDIPWDGWGERISLSNFFNITGQIFISAPYCLFLMAIMAIGCIALYRLNKQKAIFIFGWAFFYSVFYSFTAPDIFTFIRYLMPVFPAFFILLSSSLLFYKTRYKKTLHWLKF